MKKVVGLILRTSIVALIATPALAQMNNSTPMQKGAMSSNAKIHSTTMMNYKTV